MPGTAAYVLVGCQAVIGATFAWSAATKLVGRNAFAEFRRWLVTGVQVPPPVAGPAAVAAVTAEGATAAAMVIAPAVPAGFVAAALLLTVFTLAVAAMRRRRVTVPCRCFGAGRHPPGTTQLLRNLALLLVAVAGALLSGTGTRSAPLDPVGVLSVAAGAAVALLLVQLEDVVPAFRPAPVRAGGR